MNILEQRFVRTLSMFLKFDTIDKSTDKRLEPEIVLISILSMSDVYSCAHAYIFISFDIIFYVISFEKRGNNWKLVEKFLFHDE